MKKLAYIFSIALFISGCTPNIIRGQMNHWRLQAYVQSDEAKKYCAKKRKIPDLVFKDGWTYKFECKAYVHTDEIKKYCAKKRKIPDLVFKDGWTPKSECVDK